MKRYSPADIEPKWQKKWEEDSLYHVDFDSKKPKFVGFGMFNYPSGAGIHVGHVRNFTIPDVVTRAKRQQGFESYQPVGWDSFGLPAENFAIKTGVRPQESTVEAIEKYQKQYRALGWAMDWRNEISTTDPRYYRWTQWTFTKLFEQGLAYQQESPQWWCDQCKTVLADEQVIAGKCWRHDGPDDPLVTKKNLKQWFFKITDFADELLEATDTLDWTPSVKASQKSWIGRSVGAEISFEIASLEGRGKREEGREYRSYIMGQKDISKDDIESIGGRVDSTTDNGHMRVSFPAESVEKFEKLIIDKMQPGFWNEYIGDETVFIFKDKSGHTERIAWTPETEEALVKQCNQFADTTFTSIDEMLQGNDWYRDTILKSTITVFTTRPDTLFGATFMVLAPEHPLVKEITTDEHRSTVDAYIEQTLRKSEIQRQQDADKEKTGVFTGAYAINPINDEQIPIWIADYVLMGYGTGAIMAVPGHDERDRDFAMKFNLPVIEVVAPDFGIPLPDAVDVSGPVVIGYDPTTKQFMSLINTKNQLRWFASGGRDGEESYEAAARRELAEEAGYHTVSKLIQLGGPTYSYYFNSNKNSNRRSFSYMYLAIIDSKEEAKQALESHEKFRVAWSGMDEILDDLQKEQTEVGGVEHWIDGMNRAVVAAKAYDEGKDYIGPVITGDGVLFNSGAFDGISSAEARDLIVQHLAREGKAVIKTNYKMRDWLISRQRYWGAPIPIIHCPEHGAVAVPEDQLPVELPLIDNYQPTGGNASVLAGVDEWVTVPCPTCGGPAKRETDTMDGYVCSSWYFLRYLDPHDDEHAWSVKRLEHWMPIDFYNGGDHATAHLLYARFYTRFFHSIGLVPTPEPFTKMVFNGKIRAHDGSAFSKSKGNGIDPLEVIEQGYGADALRLYEMFAAPVELDVLWDTQGIPGMYRFLNRVWNLAQEYLDRMTERPKDRKSESQDILRSVHRTIKKVTDDIEEHKFNTAIASLMELTNALYKAKPITRSDDWQFALVSLLQLLAPFAPHMSEELWHQLGHDDSIHVDHWPSWDEKYLIEDTVTLAVQINGKLRAEITVAVDAEREAIEQAALAHERIKALVGDAQPKKIIVIPGRIVNIVL